MAKKTTTEVFIKKAQAIHGVKHYNYSNVMYINNTTNINIFCNIHKKSFFQSPKSHLKGYGCHLCGIEKRKNSNHYDTVTFIKNAKKIHRSEKYDYSNTKYVNRRTKVEIFCNIHKKIFLQSPGIHLNGSGCPQCAIERSTNIKTSNISIFIEKAKKIHNNINYDYSNVIYINSKKKVEIICPIHKSFFVTPNDHLSKKSGCPKCARSRITHAVQERYKDVGKEHLETAKKVHNNFYDYSKVIYTGCDDKVIISCPIHGDFKMLLDNHATQKQGCPKCGKDSMAKIRSLKLDDFIARSIKKHGDLYSYENVILTNGSSSVEIFCKKCKKYFTQEAKIHMAGSGCTTCYHERSALERALTTEEFIYKSQQIHGTNKYDYSMSKYINSRTKVQIKCNHCNYIFESIAGDHFGKASGCPKCANLISNPEKEIVEFIKSLNIKVIEGTREIIKNPHNGRKWELDIFLPEYNLAIEFNGIYFHSTARKENRNFHKEKTDACEKKGIFLLHVFEDDFKDKKDLIFTRIKQLIGQLKSISFKNTEVKIIDTSLANKFLNNYHIHGRTRATFYYGIFYKSELISVSGFLKKKNIEDATVYELVRHATNNNIRNTLNIIVNEFKNNFSETLYTFCDNSFYDYQDYIKVGFIKTKRIPPDYKYVIKSKRENKSQWKKQEIKRKLPNIYKDDNTIQEMMKEAKIYKIYDCGKTKLEFYCT